MLLLVGKCKVLFPFCLDGGFLSGFCGVWLLTFFLRPSALHPTKRTRPPTKEMDAQVPFECLPLEDALDICEVLIMQASEPLQLPPTTVRLLLESYQWNVEELMNAVQDFGYTHMHTRTHTRITHTAHANINDAEWKSFVLMRECPSRSERQRKATTITTAMTIALMPEQKYAKRYARVCLYACACACACMRTFVHVTVRGGRAWMFTTYFFQVKDHNALTDSNSNNSSSVGVCRGCTKDNNDVDMVVLACEHLYCVECWATHIHDIMQVRGRREEGRKERGR